MLFTTNDMRPMDLDPTYIPYLKKLISGKKIPTHLENVGIRRSRVAKERKAINAEIYHDVRITSTYIRSGDHDIPIRLYRPSNVNQDSLLPAIIYFHGGGWMYGSAEQSDPICVAYCRGTGAVIISPDYRLSPEDPFPAGFDDCYETLCWSFNQATYLGIDSSRLAVAGESSGGNLAAACALETRNQNGPELKLQMLNYPALGTDFDTESYNQNKCAPVLSAAEMKYFWQQYLGTELDQLNPRAVPLIASDLSNLAPAFIIVAEYDPLRDDGINYASRLEADGTPVVLKHVHRLPHGFMRSLAISEDVQRALVDIINAFRLALLTNEN
jgi:acetyl esterase